MNQSGKNELLTLVKSDYTKDKILQQVPTETPREVFAEIVSVTGTEFFTAGRNGINSQLRATVDQLDYQDETVAIYNGKRYGVYRTYLVGNDIELYLELKAGVTNVQVET